MPDRTAEIRTPAEVHGWDASVQAIHGLVEDLRRGRDEFRRAYRDVRSGLVDLFQVVRGYGPQYERVSTSLYRMSMSLDPHDPHTTALLARLADVDAEYRRIRTASMMGRAAGVGLDLPALYQAVYGSSMSAKAFRSLVTNLKDTWYRTPADYPIEIVQLAQAAEPAVQAIRGSQALKQLLNAHGDYVKLPMQVSDPVRFAALMGALQLRDLKRLLSVYGMGDTPKLKAATKKFLLTWMNANGVRMPKPTIDEIVDLEPYRPDETLVLYRGMRFRDVGALVQFSRNYGTGRPFPFQSTHWSAWSKSKEVAERFGRFNPAGSQTEAMMGWLRQFRTQKDYAGSGGYVIGARVRPDQCLVDIEKTGVYGQHGNEREVIVNPNVTLTCKVYSVFGDVQREVEEFRSDTYRSSRTPAEAIRSEEFKVRVVSVDGDILTLATSDVFMSPKELSGNPTPRKVAGPGVTRALNRHLYDAEWIDDYRVRAVPMTFDFDARLASAWGRVIVP